LTVTPSGDKKKRQSSVLFTELSGLAQKVSSKALGSGELMAGGRQPVRGISLERWA
jgi:hypothetical protein